MALSASKARRWSSLTRYSSRTSITTSSRRWSRTSPSPLASTTPSCRSSAPRPKPAATFQRYEGRRVMGIFSRLGTLIKSNLNDLISKAEDPQKMLNQIVVDMQNQLVEAKKQVAVSIADQKRLEKQRDEQSELGKEWER